MMTLTKKRTFAVLLDIGILSALTIVPLGIMAFTLQAIIDTGTITTSEIMYPSASFYLFLGTAGFTIVGCRAMNNLWYHLMLVAAGHWLVWVLTTMLTTDSFIEWLVGGPFIIAPVMGLRGMLSLCVKGIDRRLKEETLN